MPIPEESPTKTIIQATLLGMLGDVPGLGGLAGAIEGSLAAKARARDEDWLAMVAARVTLVETQQEAMLDFTDPEFVAAAHRLTRAAQETADDEKRERLAAALAHGGPWSELPLDQRERMERLLAELSSREVFLLGVLSDPRGWLQENDPEAIATYDGQFTGSVQSFLDGHISKGDEAERAAVRSAIESLSRRGLVDVPVNTIMTASGTLQGRATGLGWELVHYLRSIGL